MNVLHIALNFNGQRQRGLERMLQSLGGYQQLDWWPYVVQNRIGHFSHAARSAARQYTRGDLVFAQVQGGGILSPNDFAWMKERGLVVVCWTGDVRDPIPHGLIQCAGDVSTTCFSNDEDVETLRTQGFSSDYFQIGYDAQVYRPTGTLDPSVPEVVFLANNFPDAFPLSTERLELVTTLARELKHRFRIFGVGWPRCLGAVETRPEEEAAIYRSCKVAINHSHFRRGRYSSDRIFRITGCGAACITDRFPRMDELFRSDEEVETFDGLSELHARIDRLLGDTTRRKQLAAAGQSRAYRDHRWESRAAALSEIWSRYRV